MNILIVEDERPAADRIRKLLKRVDNLVTICGITETVEETVNWLQTNEHPDLILMDVQLDDGLCFEIFDTIKVETPVIFTTAYDQYAIRAFRVNSVDYLLKPVDEIALVTAISKYKKVFKGKPDLKHDFEYLIKEFSNQYKSRFLVKIGIKYKSISVNEISHFFINEKSIFLRCTTGRDYAVDYSLEKLQQVLNPDEFFRINRNCIISIHSISEMISLSSSRLQLKLKNEKNDNFIVSRDKVHEFKEWTDR